MNKDELLMTLLAQLDYAETVGATISTIGNKYVREAIKVIEQAEPVRHGHYEIDGHHRRCSVCREYTCIEDREGITIPKHYCPNCGAKMDEEVEE